MIRYGISNLKFKENFFGKFIQKRSLCFFFLDGVEKKRRKFGRLEEERVLICCAEYEM
jgi:hypothetical protein